MTEREDFEAWYVERGRRKYPKFNIAAMLAMRQGESYGNRTAAAAWEAWQERAARGVPASHEPQQENGNG